MNIEIGQLVKVVLEGTWYFNRYGTVTEIVDDSNEDGPIGVKFDKDDMPTFVSSDNDCIVRFKPQELVVITDVPVEYLAEKLFKNYYHSTRELVFAFSPKNYCMYEDCPNKATKRAVTNLWGTVTEVDVCDTHHKMCHGKCGEVFPMSQDYKFVEQLPRDRS